MAFLAVHVHVRQEVHFDFQRAVAVAGFAPSALDIERKTSWTISAYLSFGSLSKQRADFVPYSGIGGRIGTRGTPNRVLIDVDHFVALVHAFHPGMLAGHDACAVKFVGKHRIQNLIDQSGLAGTGNTRHAGEDSQWEINRQILQIVFTGSDHAQLFGFAYFASGLWHFDLSTTGDIVSCNRAWSVNELFCRARIDDLATMLASSRSDVDDPVGILDGVLIMLHDNQRIAEIA